MMQSRTMRGGSRAARCILTVAVLCLALGSCATSAFGTPYGRSFATQITEFEAPEAVTVTGDDHVVVSDVGDGKVTELEPYPSLAPVNTESGAGYWGGSTMVHSVTKSAANDFLYIGTDGPELPGGGSCGGTPFVVLDNFGQVVETFKPFSCEMWSAVDNAPQSDSFGRNYVYVAGKIEAFDGYGSPANFSGSASYIANNKISGTPFGGLSSGGNNPAMAGITVDSEGNIWVINQENREIDEFANTGVFIQRITEKSSGVPQFTSPSGPHGFAAYPGLTGIAVDPTNGDVLVSDKTSGVVDEFSPQGAYVGSLDGSGTPAGKFKFQCEEPYGPPPFCHTHVTGVAVNSQGYVYIADGLNGVVYVYGPRPKQPTITDKPDTNPTATGGRVNALLDLNGGGNITGCKLEYGAKVNEYKLGTLPCSPDPSGGNFTGPTEVHVDLSGLTSETTYHYRWTAENANAVRVGPDRNFTPHKVLGLRADPASVVTSSSATLHGSFVGNGASTHYWFEYGKTTSYGTKAPLPAPPGGNAGSPPGPGRTNEELPLTGLEPVTRYHYRIVAENGSTSKSEDQSFRTLPMLPQAKEFVTGVHSNQVVLNASINPGGADTVYTFEYGTEPCSEIPDPCATAFPDTHIGSNQEFHLGSKDLEGLQAATTYHYRVLATNSVGTKPGPDRTFSTFQFSPELTDPCPNALARQQTGAALASDCRAYELVSSAHAGGYDVESNLVPGQTPFDGYPNAESPLRVLYGIHNGAIPGVGGNPTNRGVDPYVATRGSEGWTTSYVGIPANDPFATSPFSSTLAGADGGLTSFAFGGPQICSPCFEDGSTGVPVHLPDGSLVNGMTGSIEPPAPASSDGLVTKRFSADGSHFVFSSTTRLEPAGNDSTGDVSIYDRNLGTGTTQVVSTGSSGSALTCVQGAGTCHAPGDGDGIAELDISEDGSRIVTGQKISTDAVGNDYYHLYMHIGSSANSADITPGALGGALYDGMTADGSKVFFTTKDHLLGTDTDASADIYEAAVGGGGTVTLRLVTTEGGSAVNDDSCTPPGVPTWNAVSGNGKCGAVAFAGGAGVASGNGTIYFLSPELLGSAAEAEGEAGEPNVYVAKPGSDPEFVTTIDSSAVKPPPAPHVHTAGKTNFRNGLERPEDIAVDQNSGDVYVAEAETGEISRWKANGTAHNFSSLTSNKIVGIEFGFGEGQVAVDSSNSPLKGDFYASTNYGNAVKVFSEAGVELGEISTGGETCGVAVDQSNGDVYVGIYPSEIERFHPLPGATAPITNADYEAVKGIEHYDEHCNIDASAEGHVYSWPYYGGAIEQFASSAFTTAPFPSPAGTAFHEGVRVESDPSNGDVYVDTSNEIVRYDSSGTQLEAFGAGVLSGGFTNGIGVNGKTGHVYASDGSSVIDFSYPPPYQPIDNPAVVHAVKQAGTHDWSDFQVSPTGQFAAFTTRMALDEGFENLEHSEVYRYDASSHALDCVSCPPTNALATGDASLASNGLSLADDGRVFFDTHEGIVLRDGDNTTDVYEWEKEGAGPQIGGCDAKNPNLFPTGICLSLISTGTSQFDSRLLSASADGNDAFFFTHDTLTHNDENGPLAKIYDARTDGGVFAIPPPALCAASDECHGPGTKEAPTPPIRTISGGPGNPTTKACKKPRVRKHGKCVHRRHRRHHNRRHH